MCALLQHGPATAAGQGSALAQRQARSITSRRTCGQRRSALPSGLLHPALAADDSHAARLSRAGFLFGRRQLDCLQANEPLLLASGVLQIAGDELAEERWPQLVQQRAMAGGLWQRCSASEACEAVGLPRGAADSGFAMRRGLRRCMPRDAREARISPLTATGYPMHAKPARG